jgi:hypothetical protein
MFCPVCGAPNDDDALYCGNCGAAMEDIAAEAVFPAASLEKAGHEDPAWAEGPGEAVDDAGPSYAPPPPPPPVTPIPQSSPSSSPPTSGLALASMLLGIGGLTLLPLVGSVLAIILGYMARRDIRRHPDRVSGDGLALAGIIMGWVAVGASVLIAVLAALGIAASICGVGLFR